MDGWARVKVGGMESEQFDVHRGVRQGSPYLHGFLMHS